MLPFGRPVEHHLRDACPICAAPVADCRLEGSQFVVCSGCGVHFRLRPIAPEPSVAWEQDYYSDDSIVHHHLARRSGFVKIEQTIASMAVGSDPSLLDVGCGVGVFLEIAQERGWQVVGVEPSAGAARMAREQTGAPVHQGDFLQLEGLPSVGVVTAFDVLRHVLEPRAFMRRAHDILLDGGWFVIRESNAAFPHNRRNRERAADDQETVSEYVQEWTSDAMRTALRMAGFSSVEVRPAPIFSDGDDPALIRFAKPLLGALWGLDFAVRRRCSGANFLALARK